MTSDNDDRLPSVGAYRGQRLHAYQLRERITTTVIPEIDRVFATDDVAGANADCWRLLLFARGKAVRR